MFLFTKVIPYANTSFVMMVFTRRKIRGIILNNEIIWTFEGGIQSVCVGATIVFFYEVSFIRFPVC